MTLIDIFNILIGFGLALIPTEYNHMNVCLLPIVLSEQYINTIVQDEFTSQVPLSNVFVDLIPDGALINGDLQAGWLRLRVHITVLFQVDSEGYLLMHVMNIGSNQYFLPQIATNIINQQVIPNFNRVLNNSLPQSHCTVDRVSINNTHLVMYQRISDE